MIAMPPGRIVTPFVATGLVLVSAISLIAFLALSAYSPDLRNESSSDANALSKSAIGFAGLRVLLDVSGISNSIDRGVVPRQKLHPSLFILTPTLGSNNTEVFRLSIPGPSLIILPKWLPASDPTTYGRVLKIDTFGRRPIVKLLGTFSKDTKINQQSGAFAPYQFSSARSPVSAQVYSIQIDRLQTISGNGWIPIIVNQKGEAVLAESRLTSVYVLADPDLMNTHGLGDLPTAALALTTITHLRAGSGPVTFDVTLNGFRRSPNLLHAAFAPPFLGATLCAILAAALIGFHAATRFGKPQTAPPAFALGKQALAGNTADLIRVMHREPHMAIRYAATTRNLALRALGIRRQMDFQQTDALFRAMERDGETTYAELAAEAQEVKSRSHLVALAIRLFRWRQGMIHAR